jgi:predicted DNA-binding protein
MTVNRSKPDQFLLRMPQGLRERIKARADEVGRSTNEEIIRAIEDSFNPESAAELRKSIAALERLVEVTGRSANASYAASDATKAVAEMYEQQVAELQDRLDQIARVSKFVAIAVKDAAEGSTGDLKYLSESLHPFQDQGIPDNPEALLARQYEFGLARLSDVSDDDRAAAHSRLVTLMEGSAELLGVDWTPPKWDDEL